MTAPRIEIVVDEIVLHDLTVTDVDAFRAALSAELTTRAQTDTVLSGRLSAGASVEVAPSPDATALGTQVAGAVWQGVAPAPEGAR
jgi:hypothetical protein